MNHSIKIGFFFILSFTASLGAVAGTMQTLQEVNSGAGFRTGYYNYSDSTYARSNAVNAIRVTFTGLTNGSDYYLWSRVDEKGATDYGYSKIMPFFSM